MELTTKARIGNVPEALLIMRDLDKIMQTLTLRPLAVSIEHERLAGQFENTHKDPFDRMLAAQASIEAYDLVTADAVFATFGISTIW